MPIMFKQIAFSDPDFHQCFQIRLKVFVEEQKVPVEEERDEYDASALHFLALQDGVSLGTARVVLKDGGATAKIGRVAVLQSARGLGVGAGLIRHIEHAVSAAEFILDAQTQALAFYLRLGYSAYGDEFIENGILHKHMRKLAEIYDSTPVKERR